MFNKHFHVDPWSFPHISRSFSCFKIFCISNNVRNFFLEFLHIFYKSLMLTQAFLTVRNFLNWRDLKRFLIDEIEKVLRLLISGMSFDFKFLSVTVWSWGGIRKNNLICFSWISHIWWHHFKFFVVFWWLGTTV